MSREKISFGNVNQIKKPVFAALFVFFFFILVFLSVTSDHFFREVIIFVILDLPTS